MTSVYQDSYMFGEHVHGLNTILDEVSMNLTSLLTDLSVRFVKQESYLGIKLVHDLSTGPVDPV